MEQLINRIRGAISVGMSRDDVVSHFRDEFSIEEIFLAFTAATMLGGS
jgi:hypothetical protein